MIGMRGKVTLEHKKVVDRVRQGEYNAVKNEANFLRGVARRSMRKRKKASAPYTPPSVHTGQLKNFLWAAAEKGRRIGAVVGPTLWGKARVAGSSKTVPEILEYGGDKLSNGRRRIRKIGGGGIIRIGEGPKAQTVKDRTGKRRRVVFGKIYTAAQLALVNANETEIYGPINPRRVHIAPRPYMGPALTVAIERHPDFWTNCIK